MSASVTVKGSLAYTDSENDDLDLIPSDFTLTVGTKLFNRDKQNIGTSEVAIKLGPVTAPGYAVFINRDTTNFIELRVATGGAKFATLKPNGGYAILYLGAGAQAPFAIADTAACQMSFFIVSQ